LLQQNALLSENVQYGLITFAATTGLFILIAIPCLVWDRFDRKLSRKSLATREDWVRFIEEYKLIHGEYSHPPLSAQKSRRIHLYRHWLIPDVETYPIPYLHSLGLIFRFYYVQSFSPVGLFFTPLIHEGRWARVIKALILYFGTLLTIASTYTPFPPF
jgi:hypothetical protein